MTEAMDALTVSHERVRIGDDQTFDATWGIVAEAPVHLVVNGQTRTVLMATPQHLDDLMRGVLHTELGMPVDRLPSDVSVSSALGEYRAEVTLREDDAQRLQGRGRSLMANSACGLCGIEALADLATRTPLEARLDARDVSDRAILAAFTELSSLQPLHAATHSAHAAAWCAIDGRIACVREDVGRHNALDKVIGALIANGMPSDGFIVMSSRCSYELVHKAAHTPARLLATWSAPTTMALEWSRHIGLPVLSIARQSSVSPRVVHFDTSSSGMNQSNTREEQHVG